MKKYNLNIMNRILSASLLSLILVAGCERSVDGLSEPTLTNNPQVFVDGFSVGLEYFPYNDGFAKLDAFQVDEDVTFDGSGASMRIDVPNPEDPSGVYAGASFIDLNGGRDLSEYDALTFYARGTKAGTINQLGFGQGKDNSYFEVRLDSLKLSTYWQKFVIPIPNASKLTAESGLFWFAENPEDGEGYSFWIDELQFETLGNIAQPRPIINNGIDQQIRSSVNLSTTITGFSNTLNTIIELPDESSTSRDVTLSIAASYFDFVSSNPGTATVDQFGVVKMVGEGMATITATLDGITAMGSLEVIVGAAFETAPVPTVNPDSVISIFSDAYTNVPVDYYNGFFTPDGQTTQGGTGFEGGPAGADIVVNGDGIINYTDLNFVGIGTFLNVSPVNASEMTHFHVDINVQEAVDAGDFITLQLLNSVGNGESSGSVTIDSNTLKENEWVSLDIPLADFGLVDRSALGLIFFVSDETISDIYVDNIYYYTDGSEIVGGPPTVNITPAPTPAFDADSVISIFSDAYTNVDVDYYNGFFTPDGQTTQGGTGFDGGPRGADFLIESNTNDGVINYTALNFVGIGTFNEVASVDASTMSHIHVDIYVNEAIQAGDFIRLQLINEVGGNEISGAVTFSSNDLQEGQWVSFDVPLSDFALTDRSKLGLIFFISDETISDIYVDNIYYYNDGSDIVELTAPVLPITFDDATVSYSATTFNGTAYDVITNPELSGSNNTASKVASVINSGTNWEGIYFDLATNLDFNDGSTITLDVYSTSSLPVLLKVEIDGGAFVEVTQTHGGSGWEELSFTFSSSASFPRITIFIDGPGTTTGTFYLDNIAQQ